MAKKAITPTPATKTTKGAVPKAAPKTGSNGAPPSATDLAQAWAASRAKPGRQSDFSPADIPDGDYVVKVISAKVGQYKSGNKQGTKYFKFRYTIVAGEHAGLELNSSDDLSLREIGTSGRTAMDLLASRLKGMGIDLLGDPDDPNNPGIQLSDLPALAMALSNPKDKEVGQPLVSVKVVNNRGTNPNTGKESWFQNVYVNEPITPEQLKEIRKQIG